MLTEEDYDKIADRILVRLGLDDNRAGQDIRDLRGLLESWRMTRNAALTTMVKIFVTTTSAVFLYGMIVYFSILGGHK